MSGEPDPRTEPDGGIVAELGQMSERERAEHFAEVAKAVAAEREISVEVGQPVLALCEVTVRFGGLTALDAVSFAIRRGEILGLIGPNGAGKTTCFNVLTGVYRPTSGQVLLEDKPLGSASRHKITQLGIARTFQNIRLFGEMTALENVVVGADARHHTSVLGALLRLPRHQREEREAVERAMALLEFVGIADRAADKAKNLPYGYQRRLEIARALATEPKLLCLDEPAAGCNPAEKAELMGLIRKIRSGGYTVLLIEHDMRLVMGVTDRIVVLEFGEKIAEGLPAEIRKNPAVIAAYREWGTMTLLELTGVSVHYGHIQAVSELSITAEEGEIVALSGANGAGKSTTMRAISGIRPVSAGRITFAGEDITRLRADLRVVRGISQVPEGRGVFPGMTVAENLDMGAYARKDRKNIPADLDRVFALFPRLLQRRNQPGGTLSGGEQQMLAIGRALMARPTLLLLDEPSMGLAPQVIQQIFRIIREINEQGTTVLLVEQNARQALSRAHRAYVLDTGRITKTGTGGQLLADPSIKEAYLGVA